MNGDDRKSLKQRFFTEGWNVIWISLVVCIIVLGLSYCFLDWLQTSSTSVETRVGDTIQAVTTEVTESGSTTLRTIGFVIAGLVAAIIAGWRGRVAGRQAQATQAQVAVASNQAAIAQATLENQQRTLMEDQYQRATAMLGSPTLAFRCGAIYRLRSFAEGNPEQYHVPVMEQLCAFVRFPPKDPDVDGQLEEFGGLRVIRPDVQAAMNAIGERSEADQELEEAAGFAFDLSGTSLSRANLFRKNFSGANLRAAILSGANLSEANLSRTILVQAILTSPWVIMNMANPMAQDPITDVTNMTDVNLEGARLSGARIIGVNLLGGKLTGASLEEADLRDAILWNAELPRAHLERANMSRASLANANLADAILIDTNLSGTDFLGLIPTPFGPRPTRGLIQDQLDQACFDGINRPDLEDATMDAVSGELLVWRGKPCS